MRQLHFILLFFLLTVSQSLQQPITFEYQQQSKTLTISGKGILVSTYQLTTFLSEAENVIIQHGITEIYKGVFFNSKIKNELIMIS